MESPQFLLQDRSTRAFLLIVVWPREQRYKPRSEVKHQLLKTMMNLGQRSLEYRPGARVIELRVPSSFSFSGAIGFDRKSAEIRKIPNSE